MVDRQLLGNCIQTFHVVVQDLVSTIKSINLRDGINDLSHRVCVSYTCEMCRYTFGVLDLLTELFFKKQGGMGCTQWFTFQST